MIATLHLMRVGMAVPAIVLAQQGGNQPPAGSTVDLWWLLWFLLGILVGFTILVALVKYAKQLLGYDTDTGAGEIGNVLSLDQVRALREEGVISQEQYEKLRDRVMGLAMPSGKKKDAGTGDDKPSDNDPGEASEDAASGKE